MIRMSWLKLFSMGAIAIGMAGVSAHADTVIGNFEDSTLDGWGSDGGPGSAQVPPPSYSQSTTGVTLGSNSVAVSQPAGSNNFWGPSTGNLVSEGYLTALETASRLNYDMTMYGSDIFTEDNTPSFAQGNELGIEISWSSGGGLTTNGSTFLQQNVASNHGNATDSLMATQSSAGQYNGVDGTRTLSWDLSKFSLTVTGFGTHNFRQFLTMFATQIGDVKFDLVQQVGDDSSDSHNYGTDSDGNPILSAPPDTFFYDNVRLVPEPVSIGGLALMSLLGLRRRK
jgi:hypothetical protein